MKVSFKGQYLGEYGGKPTLREARLLKRQLGMLPFQFGDALENGDPDAYSFLVAMMMSRLNPLQPIDYEQVDGEFEDIEVKLSEEEQKQVDQVLAERAAAAQGKGRSLSSVPTLVPATSSSDDANESDVTSPTSTESSPATPAPSGEASASTS